MCSVPISKMLTQEQIQQFRGDGFVIVKELLSLEERQNLKAAIKRLIGEWEPEKENWCVFSTGSKRQKFKSQYFIDSADKISFFVEDDAIDPITGKLIRDKHQSINKIGHGLHCLEPPFKQVTFSDKIKGIAQDLAFVKPAVCQSMYIFKPPFIGSKVMPHQDGSFLFNNPLNIVGVWIAFEDATVNNGCLWFIPGSHSKPIQRRFIRNPDEKGFNEGKMLVFTAPEEQYDDSAFVPVEIKAGDAILIHGQVVHKSEQNKSPMSRHSYTFHMIETHNSIYSQDNWLQTLTPFPLIYGD